MKRAILITGFASWGKSTHIHNVFGLTRFGPRTYRPLDATINSSFLVESRSNDDVGESKFIFNVGTRYARATSKDRTADLIAGFCPTRGQHNDSIRIFKSPPFAKFDELHLLLLKYKWDWHAELMLAKVKAYLKKEPRVKVVVIDQDAAFKSDQDRLAARDSGIRAYLRRLYP